jgi:hypothetical protein
MMLETLKKGQQAGETVSLVQRQKPALWFRNSVFQLLRTLFYYLR